MSSVFEEIKAILKWRSRNIFIDPFYILYWDLWPRLKRKKDPVSPLTADTQPKVPVTIITYKRPRYFEKTLTSFINLNKSELNRFPIIIIVQGESDQDTERIIEEHKKHIFKTIYTDVNLGCAPGYSMLMAETLKLNVPYIIHLQDDFESREPLFGYMSELIAFLSKNRHVGYVRLRSTADKVNDYNVISRRKIKYIKSPASVWTGNAHFTFNPTIVKSSVIQKIIPTTSERDAQEKYQRLGLKSGQLFAKCFSHIGHERVNDWVK